MAVAGLRVPGQAHRWPQLDGAAQSLASALPRTLPSYVGSAAASPRIVRGPGPAPASADGAAQSILSTLPRILPSYMGSTASSSQISSNTAPQANSSLAFLK